MPRRKILIFAGAALAVIAILSWVVFDQRRSERDTLTLYGNVDVREINLGFLVAGRIDRLLVEEGDKVKAGQLIASLEKGYLEDALAGDRARAASQRAALAKLEKGNRAQEIAKARADVDAARAGLLNADRDYRRQTLLAGRNIASQARLDQAKAAFDQATAQMKSARQALSLMEAGFRSEDINQGRAQLAAAEALVASDERRLQDADILAPVAGTILTRVREAGSIVAAGQPVYDMAVSEPVVVRAYVGETDVGRIVPGMIADITADSLPGKTYQGQVGFISPIAEFTPKSVETPELRTSLVYRLRIVVARPDDNLRQGMPVTVALRLAKGD